MAFSQNACNFSVPGAGKTSIVYGAYAYLHNLPEDDPKHIDRLLIVGPLSSFGPWEAEYEECFGRAPKSKRLVGGVPKNDKQDYLISRYPCELTLISYASLISLQSEIGFFLRNNRVMVVLDEAHKAKNSSGGIIAQAVLDMSRYSKARIVLTGTPAPNGYEDIYNMFKFIWPNKNVLGFEVNQLRDITATGDTARVTRLIDNICLALGWIKKEADVLTIIADFEPVLDNKDVFNEELTKSTVEQLFLGGAIDQTMFSYDSIQSSYAFKNELLPLSFSCARNVLISQGFLIPQRGPQSTHFYIAPLYDTLIAKHCKIRRKQLSLERLKKQLEDNELAGEKAEIFVVEYEKKRIGPPLCENIKRISEIDVAAGYDIVSFNSSDSREPDRFIEVKAVSASGFFWSKNEYEVAKLKGDSYYLYLVELGRIDEPGYVPEMIQDPAANVMESDDWFVEARSYHIKRV